MEPDRELVEARQRKEMQTSIKSSIWLSVKGRLSVDEVSGIMFNFAYNSIRAGRRWYYICREQKTI